MNNLVNIIFLRVVTNGVVTWYLTDLGGSYINQAPAGSDPVQLSHGDLIGLDSPEQSSVWDWQASGNVQETFVYTIKMPIVTQVGLCYTFNLYLLKFRLLTKFCQELIIWWNFYRF